MLCSSQPHSGCWKMETGTSPTLCLESCSMQPILSSHRLSNRIMSFYLSSHLQQLTVLRPELDMTLHCLTGYYPRTQVTPGDSGLRLPCSLLFDRDYSHLRILLVPANTAPGTSR